jgi:ribosome assembly protein 1
VRLKTAFYLCDLIVSSASLGKVYAVLAKRNSKILSEQMKEGTDSFVIKAMVPVTESFGFAEEVRRKSSGMASPQLVFSHWGQVHDDPFWVPHTTEELGHYGDLGDAPNPARELLDEVRLRKGLYVKRQIVVDAEKQRTLGKNK